MDLTRVGRSLLGQLIEIGGRYNFRPDGITRAAYVAFHWNVVSVLLSLEMKGLSD